MALTEKDIEVIRELLDTRLQDQHKLTADVHRVHHEAVDRWLAQEEQRQQQWRKLRNGLIGAVVVGSATALVGLFIGIGGKVVKAMVFIFSHGSHEP